MTEEEVNIVFDLCEEHMKKSIDHFEVELSKVRAGKANASMVDFLHVDYYGTDSPLNQVSNISTPDARTITIQPWEKGMLEVIEKAIYAANIGLTPQNNGESVILNIPVLTEERRKDLVKQVHLLAEQSRIGLRAARKEANDEIKQLQKDGLSEDLAHDAEVRIQEITNQYAAMVEEHIKAKEAEIMTV